MSSHHRFVIVQFPDENSVDVVASNWIKNEKCWWPPVSSRAKINSMIQAFAEPAEDWNFVKIKVLSTTGNFKRALRRVKRAEDTSHISSGAESTVSFGGTSFSRRISKGGQTRVESVPLPIEEKERYVTVAMFENFQSRIFRLLEELKLEARELRHMVAAISSTYNSSVLKELPANCPALPVSTTEDLFQLNEVLADKATFSQMCVIFTSVGGPKYCSMVRYILQSLLTNQLSTNYNWKGTGGRKLGFIEYPNIVKLIIVCVRNQFPVTTDYDVEDVI